MLLLFLYSFYCQCCFLKMNITNSRLAPTMFHLRDCIYHSVTSRHYNTQVSASAQQTQWAMRAKCWMGFPFYTLCFWFLHSPVKYFVCLNGSCLRSDLKYMSMTMKVATLRSAFILWVITSENSS